MARGNRQAVLVAARDAPEGTLVLHNHPSGQLEPSDADLAVAARLYQEGLGSAIVDNAVQGMYVVVEPPTPRVVEPIDLEGLEEMLGPEGALSRAHRQYEDRPGQRNMAGLVGERYNEGGVLLVEAGTGTGKSLAYLLPAALWAQQNGERTVISTNTINLQEQLVGKDLPLLEQVLGREVRWALVKGRGNYVSIRRARLAAESAGSLFEDDRIGELDALLQWIAATEDGSLSDLPAPPSDDVWEEVRSDSDICLRARCPHFQECFYQKARRRASGADLLVVNHHLLFSDLALRTDSPEATGSLVLPAYRHVVLDEAHNVEDAATSHLGFDVSRLGLFRLLFRLDRGGKGVLSAVEDILRAHPAEPDRDELLGRVRERASPRIREARQALESFFDMLEPLAPESGEGPVRLGPPGDLEPAHAPELRKHLDTLLSALHRARKEVEELRSRMELSAIWVDRLEGRILDLQSAERRFFEGAAALRTVLLPAPEETTFVRWIEVRGGGRRAGGRNVALAAAPVEPGSLLRKALFERVETAILTSATLATRERFAFIRRRLGLTDVEEEPSLIGVDEGGVEPAELGLTDVQGDGEGGVVDWGPDPGPSPSLDVFEALVPSPFDFGSQALLTVPTDLPAPEEWVAFQEATARSVAAFAEITGGGVFVLFTSHRATRAVADLLRRGGAESRWRLFVQGEAPRFRLLEEFVRSGDGVLLGTSSFWEGVDVPGRPLRGLVIQKLPFRVPTEPVTEARIEAMEGRGENPFWRYVLPLAALRLNQGFGRLIRSRDDRGAVLLLDSRILSRRYGGYLRSSLPPAPRRSGSWDEIAVELRRFYEGTGCQAPSGG